jgi:AcrR family transcriptional regulator
MWDRAVGAHQGRGARRPPADRLLDAAIDAFARRGYADVNVDEICRSARIAKGSFYRHYRSKEELFFAAADAAVAAIVDEVGRAVSSGPLPVDRLAEVVARSMEPRAPLFMELFTRAVQRRPGYAGAARRLFTALAYRLGELERTQDPLGAGARVLQVASVRIFRHALEPSPLAALGDESAGRA